MNTLKQGDAVPDFTAKDEQGHTVFVQCLDE